MSSERNGGPHTSPTAPRDEEDLPLDDSWKDADLADPKNLRLALVTIAGYAEVALRANLRNKQRIETGLSRISTEQAELGAMTLSALTRMEDRGKLTHAMLEGVSVRVGRLDGEKEIRHDDYLRIRRSLRANELQLADLDKREAVGRAAIEAKLEAIETARVKDDKVEARAMNESLITQRDLLKVAMTAGTELAKDQRAEDRDAAKDRRETKHRVLLWALGILGALIMMIASAFLGGKVAGGTSPAFPTTTPTLPLAAPSGPLAPAHP